MMRVAMYTLADLMWAARALVSHMAMLRMDDIREGKLRVRNFVWLTTRSCVLWVDDGKSHADPAPASIFNSFDIRSAGFVLESFWSAAKLATRADESFVFPRMHGAGKIDWTRPMDDDAFIAETRSRAIAAGLTAEQAREITGHSFRAGGCTDYLVGGLPHSFIMRQGRWTSDAFLVYFRLSRSVMAQMSAQVFKSIIGRTMAFAHAPLPTGRRLFTA